MFSFFKKNDTSVKAHDVIWLSEERKMEALDNIAKENSDTIFIAWFDETYES